MAGAQDDDHGDVAGVQDPLRDDLRDAFQGARGGAGRARVQDGHREEVQGRPRYLLKWKKECFAIFISFPSSLVFVAAKFSKYELEILTLYTM